MKIKNPLITLTTDFGLTDPYVGIMKGVILSINPGVQIVDISHQIDAGSVMQASGLIKESYSYFPKGTIHVVVVDPGVGSNRRPILVKIGNHYFVGPDNGLFFPVISLERQTTIIHLTNEAYFLPNMSRTFHGRDIFAPVAAHLSHGVDFLEMGPVIHDSKKFVLPKARKQGHVLLGQVSRIDHFGNLITNISQKELDSFLAGSQPTIKIGNKVIHRLHKTYAHVDPGDFIALIGSSNFLEISVNRDRACDRLGLSSKDGDRVEIQVMRKRDMKGTK